MYCFRLLFCIYIFGEEVTLLPKIYCCVSCSTCKILGKAFKKLQVFTPKNLHKGCAVV